jgi:hypothetical protein
MLYLTDATPTLWRIVKIFSVRGIDDFAVWCGYKGT